MNANCPPLQVVVNSSLLLPDQEPHVIAGTLVSVRAMMNQALQFSVLLDTGALYTGLPINALSTEPYSSLTLKQAQAYDCIGNDIQVICFDLLRYMLCTVKMFDGEVLKGKYLFTIDFLDNNGLARHPEQWKQFHVIDTEKGWVAYPQYRIVFKDSALCHNIENIQSYAYNTKTHLSEYW